MPFRRELARSITQPVRRTTPCERQIVLLLAAGHWSAPDNGIAIRQRVEKQIKDGSACLVDDVAGKMDRNGEGLSIADAGVGGKFADPASFGCLEFAGLEVAQGAVHADGENGK